MQSEHKISKKEKRKKGKREHRKPGKRGEKRERITLKPVQPEQKIIPQQRRWC